MMDFHPLFIPNLKRWETYQQKAYVDKGKDRPLAIGYGTRIHNASGFQFDENTLLRDEDHAMELLMADIEQHYVPQLDNLFKRIGFTAPTSGFYCGFLDALYNRGYGRLESSRAYDLLKHPEIKNYRVLAANALVLSHVEGFTPLDVAWDADLQRERVYEGLTGRRTCDAALCLLERF